MDTGGFGWGLQTVIGAALLLAVVLWAVLRNRSQRGGRDRTEQATRELYRQEEEDRRDPTVEDKGP